MPNRRIATILGFALALALPEPAAAQCEVQKLHAGDGHRQDIFGKSVAVRGAHALVGQTGLDPHDGGEVYSFRHLPSGWSQHQVLRGSDTTASDEFGYAVATTDATAVVGADTHAHAGLAATGAVYVFELEQGTWRETQELLSVGPQAGDAFGFAVDIQGDVLVASAIGHDLPAMQGAGVAYVFERRPHGWIRTADLVPTDAAAGDIFGNDVAVSGRRIVVGKYHDSGFRGAAYVFEKTPQGWLQSTKLTASDGAPNHDFGWSVDVDGDRVLVGAVRDGPSGSAYLFERGPTGWIQRAKLLPPDASSLGDFGYEVCLEGDTAFVAAPGVDGPSPPGAVYVFRRDGNAWPFVARLSPADEIPANAFGVFLATDRETLLVGAPWDDDLGLISGSAYMFDVPAFATPYGFCPGAGICGNGDPVGGCANSTMRGSRLQACGSGSLARDDFTLRADRLPPGRPVLFFRGGAAAAAPLGDGLRCVAGGIPGLHRFASTHSAPDGTASLGPGILAGTGIAPGETGYFQAWYEDPAGPCGAGFNASNAVRAVFSP
jgi:hypothetical protein